MRVTALIGVGLAAMAFSQMDTKPIVVRHNYVNSELSIELDGVCRVTDESVSCWKPDQTPHPVLEKRMDAYFQHKNRLPITFGKKTRYAVFRVSGTPWHFLSDDWSFQLNSWSFKPYGHDDLFAARIVADASAISGEVRTSLPDDSEETILELKPGASVKFQNGTLRFVRYESTKLDVGLYGIEAGPRWLIRCTFEGGTMAGAQVKAVDKDGVEIRTLDLKGKPVVVDPQLLNEFWRPPSENRTAAKPQFMEARISQFGENGVSYPMRLGDQVFATNIDPSVIGGLRFQNRRSQPLTISDIPLDPR